MVARLRSLHDLAGSVRDAFPGPAVSASPPTRAQSRSGLGVALGAAVARPQGGERALHRRWRNEHDHGRSRDRRSALVPSIVVVMNDRAYGAEFVHLQADGLPTRLRRAPRTRLRSRGSSLGIEARTATHRASWRRGASPRGPKRAPVDRLQDPPGHHRRQAALEREVRPVGVSARHAATINRHKR